MKKVKVLFFGSISEASGKKEEIVETDGSIEDLLSLLKEKYPAIKEIRHSISLNREIVADNSILADGDEVALLPPFTGG